MPENKHPLCHAQSVAKRGRANFAGREIHAIRVKFTHHR